MSDRPPVIWEVTIPEKRRQLLWFCMDPQKQLWVEPMQVEALDNVDEIMAKVFRAMTECCDVDGKIRFGVDPTVYSLKRVELRTNGELEQALAFTPDLIRLNPRILAKIVTLAAVGAPTSVSRSIERRFTRETTLTAAVGICQQLARLAATNAGILDIGNHRHFVDRIEIYYDGVFQKMFPLDYGGMLLDGE